MFKPIPVADNAANIDNMNLRLPAMSVFKTFKAITAALLLTLVAGAVFSGAQADTVLIEKQVPVASAEMTADNAVLGLANNSKSKARSKSDAVHKDNAQRQLNRALEHERQRQQNLLLSVRSGTPTGEPV